MVINANLIGAGRVGRTLLRCLAGVPGIVIGDVTSVRPASAEAAVADAGAGRAVAAIGDMGPADVWFLTVPDSAIEAVAEEISQRVANAGKTPVAIHCSGYHPASVMAPLASDGWRLASAHPMLSFADPDTAAARFPGTWVGIEGDVTALDQVEDLFAQLGARTFRMTAEGKALYHAAAVFTNNFTTVLQAIALEAWDAAGVPPDVARDLNKALLASTVENIEQFGPARALTGPAARGDSEVVNTQGRRVAEWHPEAGQLYRVLSDLAARLKTTGRTGR